ncbi:sialic acid-binding Ig-like lectin 14 isoform X1 [Xenopus laevis]|nr:sialic acid-binding Ig-like lectin 14 isoform X1 [Xenopus laevis]
MQKHVTVQKGLCVHIPCHFTVPKGEILSPTATGIWSTYRTKLVSSADSKKTRFTLTGEVSKGDCSLLINEAKLEDTGTYKFRLEDTLSYTYNSIQPNIKVTDLWNISKKEPYISPNRSMAAGEEVMLTCTAPEWCTGIAPVFTWKGSIRITETRTNALLHPYTSTYMSNITFTPSQQDHNTSLICTVTYGQVSAITSIILDVEYPPSMNITMPGYERLLTQENKSVTVIEGESLNIWCTVTSNPMANVTWSTEDGLILSTTINKSLTLALRNISLSNAATYRCLAWNSHGNTNDSITLSLEYPPKEATICIYKSNPDGLLDCYFEENSFEEVEEGTSLSLLCTAKSNPTSNVSWIRHGQTNIQNISAKQLLNVTQMGVGSTEVYICWAENKYGQANRSITIKVTSATKQQQKPPGIMSALFVVPPLVIVLLLISAFIMIRNKRRKQLLHNDKKQTTSTPVNDCDAHKTYEEIPQGSSSPTDNTDLEIAPKDENLSEDGAPIYINYGEDLQYACIHFSHLKPNDSPEKEEVEYSEIQCKSQIL